MFEQDRNVFDALAVIGGATAMSGMASRNGTLRYTVDGSDSLVKDVRFILGAVGLLAAGVSEGMVGRVGNDVATASLASLGSTEMVLRASRKRFEEQQAQGQAAPQQGQQQPPQFAAPFSPGPAGPQQQVPPMLAYPGPQPSPHGFGYAAAPAYAGAW